MRILQMQIAAADKTHIHIRVPQNSSPSSSAQSDGPLFSVPAHGKTRPIILRSTADLQATRQLHGAPVA